MGAAVNFVKLNKPFDTLMTGFSVSCFFYISTALLDCDNNIHLTFLIV